MGLRGAQPAGTLAVDSARPRRPACAGNVNPIGERSCYDEGKRAAECLTMDYHREHGQEVGMHAAWGLGGTLRTRCRWSPLNPARPRLQCHHS